MRLSAFAQIALVIFFRPPKSGRGFYLSDDRPGETAALFQVRLGSFGGSLLFGRMIKDDRPILRPNIGPLPIQSGRIMIRPKNIEQFLIPYFAWIELDLDNFGVSGFVGTNVFVGRIFRRSARVADRGRSHTFQLPKGLLDAPKTSRAKCRFLCFHKRTMERLPAPRNRWREIHGDILRLGLAPAVD